MDSFPCPNRKCDKTYSTLEDTVRHLESEECGFRKYEQIQEAMIRLVGTPFIVY